MQKGRITDIYDSGWIPVYITSLSSPLRGSTEQRETLLGQREDPLRVQRKDLRERCILYLSKLQ